MVVFFANTGVENRSLQMFDVKAIATCSDKKQRQTNERTERQAGRQGGKQTDSDGKTVMDGQTGSDRQTQLTEDARSTACPITAGVFS